MRKALGGPLDKSVGPLLHDLVKTLFEKGVENGGKLNRHYRAKLKSDPNLYIRATHCVSETMSNLRR